MSEPNPPVPVSPPAKKEQPYDAGHVPMSDEFDKAKWTLPSWQPVVIALVLVAIALAIVSFTNRAKPVVAGGIDNVVAVDVPGNSVLVAISMTVGNVSQKSLWVHTLKAKLTTDAGEFTDEAAPAMDFDRYFQAFSALKEHAVAPLKPDDKIAPGGTQKGMIIVSFPVNKETFDKRKSLSVIVEPWDQRPVVLTK